MPKEMSLNDPLSGAEIKQIALLKFADALNRDCTLNDDLTYPGFHLKFDATISYVRSTTQPTMMWKDEFVGEKVGGEIEAKSFPIEYKTDSPNTAREENDLPIPVMIQTPTGPKRQKVAFQKPVIHGKQKN